MVFPLILLIPNCCQPTSGVKQRLTGNVPKHPRRGFATLCTFQVFCSKQAFVPRLGNKEYFLKNCLKKQDLKTDALPHQNGEGFAFAIGSGHRVAIFIQRSHPNQLNSVTFCVSPTSGLVFRHLDNWGHPEALVWKILALNF